MKIMYTFAGVGIITASRNLIKVLFAEFLLHHYFLVHKPNLIKTFMCPAICHLPWEFL